MKLTIFFPATKTDFLTAVTSRSNMLSLYCYFEQTALFFPIVDINWPLLLYMLL